MGKVNFRSDLVAFWAVGTWRLTGSLALRLEMHSHFFRFVFFKRTRMGLFLGDPNRWKYIEDRFALHFQLPGQIIDSNLTHPPSISSGLVR